MQNVGDLLMMKQPSVLFICCLFCFSASVFGYSEKRSLKQLSSELKKGPEISGLFKSTAELNEDPTALLKPLMSKDNRDLLKLLEKNFNEGANFIRGEVEDEGVRAALLQCLYLGLLEARSEAFQSKWPEFQQHLSAWFQFAADFPYEEGSLVGLRLSGELRSLLLDDFEKVQKKFSNEIASRPQLRQWFSQIRAPWPVDRVLVGEAKRMSQPAVIPLADTAARAFQKNPYQTTEQALRRIKGSASTSAERLKQMWKESDILLMKTEITRIGKLKLRLAAAEFELANKKAPTSVEELFNAGLLKPIPIDYLTGKPLDLTSL
jgi:hypothetical protein